MQINFLSKIFLLFLIIFPKILFAQQTTIDGYDYTDAEMLEFSGRTSTPSTSSVGKARQYFDAVSGKLKCSQNGGIYTDCVGSSGWTLGASNVGISTTNNVGIGTAAPIFPLEIVALNVVGDTAVSIRNSDGSTNDSASLKLVVSGTGGSSSRSELTSIRTSSTTQDLSFKTNVNGLFSEVMRLTGGGNIGIGTTSPGTALVLGSGQLTMPVGSAAAPTMLFSNSTNSGFYTVAAGTISYSAAGTPVVLMSANTGNGSFPKAFRLSSTTIMGWSSGNPDTLADDTSLSRGTAGTIYVGTGAGKSNGTLIASNVGIGTTTPAGALTVMNGNVGIGTWVPETALHVIGRGGFSNGIVLTGVPTGSSDINYIQASNSASTVGFLAGNGVFNAASGPYFGARGNTYSVIGSQRGQMFFSAGDVNTPVGNEGKITFYTTPGGGVAESQRMTIGRDGNVGIGTTTPMGGLTVMSGNVGIGTWVPASSLSVAAGNGVSVGLTYGSKTAGSGNIIIEGNIGVGTYILPSNLNVGGNISLDRTTSAIIMKEPDGTCGSCTLSNLEVFTCVSATCP